MCVFYPSYSTKGTDTVGLGLSYAWLRSTRIESLTCQHLSLRCTTEHRYCTTILNMIQPHASLAISCSLSFTIWSICSAFAHLAYLIRSSSGLLSSNCTAKLTQIPAAVSANLPIRPKNPTPGSQTVHSRPNYSQFTIHDSRVTTGKPGQSVYANTHIVSFTQLALLLLVALLLIAQTLAIFPTLPVISPSASLSLCPVLVGSSLQISQALVSLDRCAPPSHQRRPSQRSSCPVKALSLRAPLLIPNCQST